MESSSLRRAEGSQSRERVRSVATSNLIRDPSMSRKKGHASSSNHKQSKSKDIPKKGRYFNHPQVVRPKRPRSAYNLFFKDQRNQMLKEAGEALSTDEDNGMNRFKVVIKDMPKSFEMKSDIPPEATKRKRGRPRGPNYKPRKACKRRGAFSFSQLAKLIGPKWKNLDEASKSNYKEEAAVDLRRYREAMEIYNSTVQRLEEESRKTGPPNSTHSAPPSMTTSSSVSWSLLPSTNESSSSRSSASSSARTSPTSFSNIDTNPVNQGSISSKNDQIDNLEPPCVSICAFESNNTSSTSPSGRASPTFSTSSIHSSDMLNYARDFIGFSAIKSNVSDSASGDSVSKTTDNSTDGERRGSAIEHFRAESFTSNSKKKESPWDGCSAPFRQGDIVQLRTSAKASALVMASRNVVQQSGEIPRSDKRFSFGTQSSTPSESKSNTASPSGGKFRWDDHCDISRETNLQDKSRSQGNGLQQRRGLLPSARFLVQHNPFMSSSSSTSTSTSTSHEANDDVCDWSDVDNSLSSDKSRDKGDPGTSEKYYRLTQIPANVYTSSSSNDFFLSLSNRDIPERSLRY